MTVSLDPSVPPLSAQPSGTVTPVPAGWRLFARYAYAPNAKGYCGPPQAAVLETVARGGAGVDVVALAKRFSGAWPYHVLIAELAGIDDPLDERVGRAYWTGSDLTSEIDARQLGGMLIERFSRQAGHYWKHLDRGLLEEITPTHAFHVLAVYPWSRLLASGRPEPLQVLDSCRIRSGEVVATTADRLVVSVRSLCWDGRQLTLSRPDREDVTWWPAEGSSATAATVPEPGTRVAIHWGHACEPLSGVDHDQLEYWTGVQLEATNRRLGR